VARELAGRHVCHTDGLSPPWVESWQGQTWRVPSLSNHFYSFFTLSPFSPLRWTTGIGCPFLSSKVTSWRCHLIKTKSTVSLNNETLKQKTWSKKKKLGIVLQFYILNQYCVDRIF
jgi:hypothetical protein